MEALHARKDLQKILAMFKQLEPALEFDDGKVMNKSVSRNRDDATNASGTNDSNKKMAVAAGGEYSFTEHLDLQRQSNEQPSKGMSMPMSEVVSQSMTPGSATETISELRRQARHEHKGQKDPYQAKLSTISQEIVNTESDSDHEFGSIADKKSPLEKLIDLKLKYGLKDEEFEEFEMPKSQNKFVTFKTSMRDTMTTIPDDNKPIVPHVNPKKHLIKPRPEKKEPTYVQKKLELKKPVKLSLNDQEILGDLKERLLQYMGEEKEDEKKRRAKSIKALGKEKWSSLSKTMPIKETITQSKKQRARDDQWDSYTPTSNTLGKKKTQMIPNAGSNLSNNYQSMVDQSSYQRNDNQQYHHGKTMKLPKNKSNNNYNNLTAQQFKSIEQCDGSEQQPEKSLEMEYGHVHLGVGFGLEGPSLNDYGCIARRNNQSMNRAMDSGSASAVSPKSSQQQLRMRSQELGQDQKRLEYYRRVASIRNKLDKEIRSYQTRAGKPNGQASNRRPMHDQADAPKSPKSKSTEPRLSGQENAQLYKILRNLNSKNLEGKKNQMKNQLNEAHSRVKQKEQRLRDLYQQLEEVTHLNTREEMAHLQAESSVKPQVRQLLDSNKCYQHTVQDTLMDADATNGHFDYSSISSILQRKEVLVQKLMVVEKKQKEEENLNAQYLKQKQKLELRNLVEGRRMDMVGQKEQNLEAVAKELAEMNIIENQRKYHVDSLLYHYKKEIQKDQQLMDKIEEEKMITHKNQEEETKQILHEMLNHLRDIKDLKKGLMEIEEQKQNNAVKEQEIIAAFNTRKAEINLLNQMSQLQKIEEYSKKLDEVGMNGDINDDSQRLKGLDLVDKLKEKLKSSKMVPSFRADEKKEQHHGGSSREGRAHKTTLKRSSLRSSPQPRPESRVVSRSSSADGPTQMHDQDQFPIIIQLENYIEYKHQYDQFYQEYYRQAMSVDIQGVVQTYLQSNTKLKYLQNGFKSREQDKMEKVLELQKIQEYYEYLREEKKLVGDYLNKIGFNQEHKIQDIFNFEHTDPIDPEGDQTSGINSRLPQSVEVMQMYIDGIQQKNITLYQMVASLKGLINQFYSQFRYQIHNGVGVLRVIKKAAQNIMIIQDSEEIAALVSRYFSSQEKTYPTSHQHEKASKWCSTTKTGSRRKQSVSKGQQKEESQGSQNSRMSKDSQREVITNADAHLMANKQEYHEQKDKYGGKFDEYIDKMGHLTEHLTMSQIFLILDIRILVQILSGSSQKILFSPKYQKRSKHDPKYQANLNYADFDPVFRRKEFSSIQKNVAKKLQLNRHLTPADKKQLLQKLKQSKEATYNMEPDEDTVEFLDQEKGKGWRNINHPPVLEEVEIPRYNSDASDDELTKSEKAAAQALIKSTFENLTKDKRDNQIQHQMNELFRQKHHAQDVQRNEKFFIMDLKSKIEDRYSKLRESFEQEYCDTYKEKKQRMSKTAEGHARAKTLEAGENPTKEMNRDIFSALSTNQSRRTASKLHNPKYMYQKADEGDEEIIVSPVQRLQNFPGRWVNYTTVEEASQLDYKPVKSICFDFDRKKAPLTASIKERIKINKNLTKHTLRSKLSHSLHFRSKTKQLLGDGAMMSMQTIGDVGSLANARQPLSAFSMSQQTAGTDRVARNLLELSKTAAAVRNRFDPSRKSTGAKPISYAWNMQNSGYSANMNFNTQYGTVAKQSERVNKFVSQKQKKYNNHLYNTYVKRSANSPKHFKDQRVLESPTRRYNKFRTKAPLDAAQKSANDSAE